MLNLAHRIPHVFAAVLLLLSCASHVLAADQTLGGMTGDPLQVVVSDAGTINVFRFNSVSSAYEDQYFSPTDYDTFLVTNPSATASAVYTGSGDVGSVAAAVSSTSASTTFTAGDNIQIVHTVTYLPTTNYLQHSWTLTNKGATRYAGLSMRYGGDTHFLNDDSAIGFIDLPSGLLYSVNPNAGFTSGIMGLYADATTPATGYEEDGYQQVTTDLADGSKPLSNTVVSGYVDNGDGLEWVLNANQLPPFNAGTPVTITAWEIFDTPLQVTVTPPASTLLQGSVPTNLTFDIANLESGTDTFDLVLNASPGITIQSWSTIAPTASNPTSVTLAANAHTQLTVTVSGSAALAANSLICALSVVARSHATPLIIGQGDVALAGEFAVEVAAQPEQGAIATQPETATFTVTNLQSQSDTYTYTVVADPGITVSGIASAVQSLPSRLRAIQTAADALGTNQSSIVTVAYTGDASLVGTKGHITLTATSQTNATLTASGTAVIDVAAANIQVQVVAPEASVAPFGSTFPVVFNVFNLETVSDTFVITAAGTNGYGVVSVTPTPATIPANSFTPVVVLVSVGARGTSGTVTITATSRSISTITSSSIATVSVAGSTAPQPVPGVAVAVPTTTLPVSTNGHIVFIPLCPSTPEGVTSLLDTLAGLPSGSAVAYAWDASVQGFAKLPAVPAGGLLPTDGVFIATAVALDFDLSGTSELAPAPIPLQPGWNLVGVPPVDFGSGVQTTSHPFPSGFALIDPVTGVPVTSLVEFISILGTGTTDITTTYPYLYNGTTYTQVSTLQSGTAYWINNKASTTVYLERVASGPTLSALHRGTVYAGAASSPSQPPSVPASGISGDSSSGRCGIAAGSGLLMGLALLFWRRRH